MVSREEVIVYPKNINVDRNWARPRSVLEVIVTDKVIVKNISCIDMQLTRQIEK